MNYMNVYQKLIHKAQSRQKPDCYTETHHIMPKSLGGTNDPNNLVELTAREHFIAHLLLAKIYGGPMIYAAWALQNTKTNRNYAWLKEKLSERMKGNKNFAGKSHTPEFRKNLAEANKNRVWSDESKQKLGKTMSLINKGENNPNYNKKGNKSHLSKAIVLITPTGDELLALCVKTLTTLYGLHSSHVRNCLRQNKDYRGYNFREPTENDFKTLQIIGEMP